MSIRISYFTVSIVYFRPIMTGVTEQDETRWTKNRWESLNSVVIKSFEEISRDELSKVFQEQTDRIISTGKCLNNEGKSRGRKTI